MGVTSVLSALEPGAANTGMSFGFQEPLESDPNLGTVANYALHSWGSTW